MASLANPTHVCCICGTEVSLEECKTDEHGQPVHEDCYVARIRVQDDNTPQKVRIPA